MFFINILFFLVFCFLIKQSLSSKKKKERAKKHNLDPIPIQNYSKIRMDYPGATFSIVLKSCNLRRTKTCASPTNSVKIISMIKFSRQFTTTFVAFRATDFLQIMPTDIGKWNNSCRNRESPFLYVIKPLHFQGMVMVFKRIQKAS